MTGALVILEPFSQLMLALYRAAREVPAEEFQEAALLLLKPVLGFNSSIWGSGTFSEAGLAVHSIYLHEQPAELIEEWQPVNNEDTTAQECAKRMGWVMNAHIRSLYREKQKAGVCEVAKKFGIENVLVVGYQRRDMPLVNWISLYRKDPDRHFSEHERAVFEALVPHVVEALAINRLINLDSLYTPHQHRKSARAIADRRGAIHHSEGGFDEVVRKEWPCWHSTVLPTPLVAALNRADLPAVHWRRIAVEVHRVADLYFLKARALTAIDSLSQRERQVAEQFGQGRSHKEVARLLGITPATVRNHLQTAYGKLGVGDKAQLAQRLFEST